MVGLIPLNCIYVVQLCYFILAVLYTQLEYFVGNVCVVPGVIVSLTYWC